MASTPPAHGSSAQTAEIDVEPEFDELRNEKNGDTVPRDEIALITPVGPYESR